MRGRFLQTVRVAFAAMLGLLWLSGAAGGVAEAGAAAAAAARDTDLGGRSC